MSLFGGRRQPPEPSDPSPTGKPAPAPRQPVGFETVLGASTTLSGDLRSQGNVRMDGLFEGTFEIDGNVLIGETAKITADIYARNISIAGAVRGNVHGNKVQILRTGRVWGDINARAITTEEGAFIDGKITMIQHEAALESGESAALLAAGDVDEPDFLAQVDAAGDEIGDDLPADEEDSPAEMPSDDLLDDDDPLGKLPIDEDGAVG